MARATPSVLSGFGTMLQPGEAQQPILAREVRGALMEWITEIWAEKDLADVGLKSRKRAIFDGPPGVGKTTLAHHLAARLGLPMLAVRPERIRESWHGQSERNLGALFDQLQESDGKFVLFFDEFDALARARREAHQAVDDANNALVDVLLQRMDASNGFIIAATNHGKQIDEAVWRRFEIHITLKEPGPDERFHILKRYLSPYKLHTDQLRLLAESFATATPALMRQFCEGIKRQLVIGPKVGWDMTKNATIERLLAAMAPHPDLGKPRLWSHGINDLAIRALWWPLTTEPKDSAPEPSIEVEEKVIPLKRGAA